MSLQRWDFEARPSLRVGYALFDTEILGGPFATYHSMLVAAETIEAEAGVSVRIAEMGPPLRFGEEQNAVRSLHDRNYVGWLIELTEEDYQQVIAAANSLRGRPPSSQGPGFYWLGAHGVEVSDPNDEDGAFVTPHCSCASLVEWCYEEVGIDLVDAATIPTYSAKEIQATFCHPSLQIDLLRRMLRSCGLKGDGPWPLLLPAHQMMAFRDGHPRHATKEDHPWKHD